MSILVVANLLGHTNAVMTLKVYGHVANDSLQESAARLNGLRQVAW